MHPHIYLKRDTVRQRTTGSLRLVLAITTCFTANIPLILSVSQRHDILCSCNINEINHRNKTSLIKKNNYQRNHLVSLHITSQINPLNNSFVKQNFKS